jgi:hypothetical protein
MVRGCIECHIDPWRLSRLRHIETQERETLKRIGGAMEHTIAPRPQSEALL